MVSKVICFASAKGGTGKTTISATLAKFLAALGKKVLLVDTDAATNGLTLLYMEEVINAKRQLTKEGVKGEVYYFGGVKKRHQTKEVYPKGIFEVTEDELPTPVTIDGAFDMIPSTYVLQQTEGIPEEAFRRSISKTLSVFREEYDYIMLDAQAGSNIYAGIATEYADEVVIVSEFDPLSAVGVERLKVLFQIPYEKHWILLNKILPEFAKSFSEFLKIARYLSPVPWDAEVVRAFVTRRLAIDTERGSPHTLAIMQTAISLLGGEIEEEVNRWKQEKEQLIREPVYRQLEQVEDEIEFTEKAAVESQYRLRDLQRKSTSFVLTILLTFGVFAGIIISIFYLFLEPWFYLSAFLLPLFILSIPLLFIFGRIIEKQSRKQAEEVEAQYRIFESKLEDLKERRKKYKALSEYDLKPF